MNLRQQTQTIWSIGCPTLSGSGAFKVNALEYSKNILMNYIIFHSLFDYSDKKRKKAIK